jgi:hypothetical protein
MRPLITQLPVPPLYSDAEERNKARYVRMLGVIGNNWITPRIQFQPSKVQKKYFKQVRNIFPGIIQRILIWANVTNNELNDLSTWQLVFIEKEKIRLVKSQRSRTDIASLCGLSEI